MTPVEPASLAAAMHEAGWQFVLAVTGGGSRAISDLLVVPGASRTVLEAVVPYSADALIEWLGARPDSFCSERTARAMAMVAFQHARRHAGQEAEVDRLAGIASTASLASDRPKRGDHRAHLALQTAGVTLCLSVVLEKGRRGRSGEEELVGRLILNLAAEAAGLDIRTAVPLTAQETVQRRQQVAPDLWRQLLLGQVPAILAHAKQPAAAPKLLFPGAFNPRHHGHRRMADIAAQREHAQVEYEISIENVDKPELDYCEIADRLGQFEPDERVWLTRADRFDVKARLFPGVTFVVGADTVRRIAHPKYYGGSPDQRDAAIAQIAERRCRFLVFGRRAGERFETVAELDLPPALAALCRAVPEADFREDISSTEIRKQQATN